MSGFTDFAEILEQKIRKEIENEYDVDHSQAVNMNEPDYTYMSWILGQTPKMSTQNGFQHTLYKQYQPKQQPRPAHKFNSEQEQAFHKICEYASAFKDNFTLKELKQAFRQAALITHPDQGGSSMKFIEIQKAFQSLQSLF